MKSIDNITKSLLLSFFVLITILTTFSIYSIKGIKKISNLTRNIIEKPLCGSSDGLQVLIKINKMHKDMKDIVLYSNDKARITFYINNIALEEIKVYKL